MLTPEQIHAIKDRWIRTQECGQSTVMTCFLIQRLTDSANDVPTLLLELDRLTRFVEKLEAKNFDEVEIRALYESLGL